MKLLEQKLGIEHIPKETNIVELIPEEIEVSLKDVPDPEDIKEDYRLARKTFRDLISKGTKALDALELMTKEAETAREGARIAEVMATLMKTVSDTTKDMFHLQRMAKELTTDKNKKQENNTNINVDKAVFCGTTADLLRKIKSEQ